MMSGEAWLYLLSVLINAVNLFLQVFFTIMYSDLEWYVDNSDAMVGGQLYPSDLKTNGGTLCLWSSRSMALESW